MECRLHRAVHGDLFEVGEPGLSRTFADFAGFEAGNRVPGAFHVGGGEGLAVVPFHSVTQGEGQFGLAVVPAPGGGKFRDDCIEAVLRLVLIVDAQIVGQRHEREDDGGRRLLLDGGAGRAVYVFDGEDAAMFGRRIRGRRGRSGTEQ